MARGTTFGQLIEMTRMEAGVDPDPALSINSLGLFQRLIRREYERLYDDFDWPFLRIFRDVMTQAGQRYYDIPVDLDLERVEKVEYRWGDRWYCLERGISVDDYDVHDSDADVRMEPAWKWDVTYTGPTAQVEIWPIPVVDNRKIRFTGIRKLTPLNNDDDRCDLDDQMVSLFAASEYLARNNAPEAGLKQQKAVARMNMMRGRSIQKKDNSFSFGQPKDDYRDYRGPLVAYVRNP